MWARFVKIASVLVPCALALLIHGCKSDARDPFIIEFDAGTDASDASSIPDAEGEIDPTLGGPCTEDAQCDDLVACTFDRCDKTLSRCRNTPDDAQCADTEYCNGQEKCRLRQGCVAGPVVTCQDSDGCTIDRCVEATKSCEHVPRDSDGDGDPDDHCSPKRDCDDTDPTVSSTASEICGNFRDDNCNGQIDEQPCSAPANDTCATAKEVSESSTLLLTTVAASKNYSTNCALASASARDIVVGLSVPPGKPPQDITVYVESRSTNEIAVAMQETCGELATERHCGYVPGAISARTIARNVSPGEKRYAIITTQRETPVDVRVVMTDAKPAAANETCDSATKVEVNTPIDVSLIDAARDHASSCTPQTGELAYYFELSERKDVRIFASTTSGPATGKPIISLRETNVCGTELRCRIGDSPPVFARDLAPGRHTFLVYGTGQLDANVIVKTFDPTTPPADQSCVTAPDAPLNKAFSIDFSGHEDAIKNGCLNGNPDAAYRVKIDEPSDMLVVVRAPPGDTAGISLHPVAADPECAAQVECVYGASGPPRISKRNLTAGEYRIVAAESKGLTSELLVLLRKTAPPVTVTADTCESAPVIPETGGFFVGSTAGATGNYNASCDATGQAQGGAPDQMLRLDLQQDRRVIFDMIGSSYETMLTIRTAETCPGSEVENGCAVGAGLRSYKDILLKAGSYWVQIDGYAGQSGGWSLDVRVLPP